jgi:hypothetical protein
VEIILGLVSLAVTVLGYVLTRTDKLLKEIRDTLHEIRDGLESDRRPLNPPK